MNVMPHRAARPLVLFATAVLMAGTALAAGIPRYPAAFRTTDIQVEGVTLHVRVGGSGPAVVLLHGFGDTGDMWAPLATRGDAGRVRPVQLDFAG
ncbi:alpha/beta fold hydrolase [Pseudoduganella dura]|uniref:alpha/beta fold hydrolase n=1 Tax=Pseudoduganella dura TaxID=321982 RepID=UPI0019B93B8B|nr:hypothetical protein GCM10007386_45050 [Pseudoduganella dura]